MGFALFSSAQFAVAAKDSLQEMIFDAESKSVLHTEMAKKNLFVKRGLVADSNAYDQSNRLRTGGDYSHSAYRAPPFHPPAPVWGPHGYMAPTPPYAPYGGYPVPPMPMPTPAPVPAPSSYVSVQNTKDNFPCNTLFIGNLGENINEEELSGIFSAQPGFKQMKILRQERHTVCFIEFEDVNAATNVHQSLQGAVIPSSGSVGMRIQYPFVFHFSVTFLKYFCFPFLFFSCYVNICLYIGAFIMFYFMRMCSCFLYVTIQVGCVPNNYPFHCFLSQCRLEDDIPQISFFFMSKLCFEYEIFNSIYFLRN
ncbi:hypothetical protein DITRI_Ditri19aG0203900 [Diplodiscus trichospermus]